MEEIEAKRLFAEFLVGVSVLTCRDGAGRLTGMTASAICPLGLKPPSLLVCVANDADVLPDLRREAEFSVNLLHAGQAELAWGFALAGAEKRARIDSLAPSWTDRPDAAPALQDSLARIDCRLQRELDGGDHRILIATLLGGQAGRGAARPLAYFRSRLDNHLTIPGQPG